METRIDGQTDRNEAEHDAISREMYEVFAKLECCREQRAAAASVSGEEGLLHYLVYHRDGVTSGFLRKQLGVGSGRMADILRQLEEKKMIIRCEDQSDCRRVIVHVTDAGREQAHRTNARVLAWYDRLEMYLGEADSRELVRILRKMNDFPG